MSYLDEFWRNITRLHVSWPIPAGDHVNHAQLLSELLALSLCGLLIAAGVSIWIAQRPLHQSDPEATYTRAEIFALRFHYMLTHSSDYGDPSAGLPAPHIPTVDNGKRQPLSRKRLVFGGCLLAVAFLIIVLVLWFGWLSHSVGGSDPYSINYWNQQIYQDDLVVLVARHLVALCLVAFSALLVWRMKIRVTYRHHNAWQRRAWWAANVAGWLAIAAGMALVLFFPY